MQGEKGGDFFGEANPKGKKILPEPCMEKSPYIESEKGETLKGVKKVDISIVLEIFVCVQIDTLPCPNGHTRK